MSSFLEDCIKITTMNNHYSALISIKYSNVSVCIYSLSCMYVYQYSINNIVDIIINIYMWHVHL